MKIASLIIVAVLVMGTLLVIDSIQKAKRESNSVEYKLTESDGQIKAYDVEGLSDEEISNWLERERAQE
jgi:hypothetical protein